MFIIKFVKPNSQNNTNENNNNFNNVLNNNDNLVFFLSRGTMGQFSDLNLKI